MGRGELNGKERLGYFIVPLRDALRFNDNRKSWSFVSFMQIGLSGFQVQKTGTTPLSGRNVSVNFMTGQAVFCSLWRQENCFFSTEFRLALGPTQPPIQCVLGAFSSEGKAPLSRKFLPRLTELLIFILSCFHTATQLMKEWKWILERPGREDDRSLPSSTELNNAWNHTSTLHASLWHGA
jgi:hypothetical protein